MNYNNIFNRDYKSMGDTASNSALHKGRVRVLAVTGLTLLGLVALLNPTDDASATRHPVAEASVADTDTRRLTEELELPSAAPAPTTAAPAPLSQAPALSWQEVTVRPGDTLAAIFERLDLGGRELYALMQADRNKTATLKQLLPGQTLRFGRDSNQQLVTLQYQIDALNTLELQRTDDGYSAQEISRPLEKRLAYTSATIENSLFAAGQRVGLSDAVIMELAAIFGWDVDFALDIRSGDTFTVVYEQAYLDGEKLRDGDILAAEFVNQGQTYRAIRYTDPQGNSNFYTPEGLSMRKAFLRSPVDFNRISSRFQTERYHPVLGIKRPHRGVDYAAAVGTPIKAAGDGKIEFRGRKGGYGNVVILSHGGAYRTLYGHMSSFRKGLGTGSRVKQGQVIGYVGQTGVATGPHLHYEFLVNGVHRNPLTVKLPTAEPIAAQYKDDFLEQAKLRLAQLDTVKRTTLALNTQ